MHRQGKWAQRLIAIQQSDGSWGRFHSMAPHGDSPVTTEQALARLRRLGCTMEDDCIRRAVKLHGRLSRRAQCHPRSAGKAA